MTLSPQADPGKDASANSSSTNGQANSDQLSLLPEYTDSAPAEERADSASEGSSRWLTLLGLILLIVLGYFGWRWWQGRNAQQAQQGPRTVPVELQSVDIATVEEVSTFTGNLEAERSVGIQAEQEGRIVEIYVQQGQAVSAGAPILRLSAEREQSDVDAAQARIEVARATQDTARSELESLQAERERLLAEIDLQRQQFQRTSELVEAGALPEAELDLGQRDVRTAQANLNSLDRQIQAARDRLRQAGATLEERQASLNRLQANLTDTTVTAPFAGIVGDITVDLGDYVQLGQSLAQLVDNDTLNLNLSVPQERSDDLERGLPVEIIASDGSVQKQGQISFISPQVDSDSQFIQTEAVFPNPDRRLRDGQFVRTEVIWEQRSGQVVVPQTAVVYQGEDRFVYIPEDQEGQMVAMRQPVELGLEQGTEVEIVSGLQPGQEIIVSGIQKIGDGVPIQPLENQASQRGDAS
ncbi:efflux RND transporter periplasmic adaptor subunit [filamentous cyanobacterium CCP5]|nr:efflux RND transporter periplasmic adaptor subunit [filamentous cyanobacterium CCP5]